MTYVLLFCLYRGAAASCFDHTFAEQQACEIAGQQLTVKFAETSSMFSTTYVCASEWRQ